MRTNPNLSPPQFTPQESQALHAGAVEILDEEEQGLYNAQREQSDVSEFQARVDKAEGLVDRRYDLLPKYRG